ncbi:hypothetical protein PHAVU_005G028300 [Phaseolus vulgaris]|uniref:RING-type E3 ubiquitin transferase n=1 Tax=Phaseolus vulgaris TaxID=3885 RepID=V7BSG7_PHAVU|nr:hypothetical protein PHAVU_005G028300g [Phaseolus vulgaris]ESW20947.1 hypothetical protein PHAVU_005G028300g [Phaseolus vulgaris]
MGTVEGKVYSYHCEMRTKEVRVKMKLKDILRVDANIIVRYYNHHLHATQTSTLLKTSIPISFQNFFENNADFLRTVLFDPRCSYCFIPEIVDPILATIVNMIKVALEFGGGPESVDSECKEFPMNLNIIVDVVADVESEEEEEEEEEDVETEVEAEVEEEVETEEEMEHYAATIPASAEVIDSLKTFSISPFLKKETEKCNIYLENVGFRENEENVKLSSLPCEHVFHHLCIVNWLQTSHTCPLCRYPMPVRNN